MNNETIKSALSLADHSKKAGEITGMYRNMAAFTEHAKKARAFLDQQQKLLAVNENAKKVAGLAAVAGVACICVAFAVQYIESHKPVPSLNLKTKKP